MSTYPTSGSILDSNTRTALSTQIIVMVGTEPVGSIQSFSESQNRGLERIKELGLDGTLEITPSSATEISLRVDRIVFDGLSITEAFARGFRNIQAQRKGFDIVVIDNYTGDGDNSVITTYSGCWLQSVEKTYNADNFIITENVSIEVEAISTLRGGEAVALSQGVGGGRQIPIQLDDIEQGSDSGKFRGSATFINLLSATL